MSWQMASYHPTEQYANDSLDWITNNLPSDNWTLLTLDHIPQDGIIPEYWLLNVEYQVQSEMINYFNTCADLMFDPYYLPEEPPEEGQ